jgi:hypothetical protein
MAGPAHPTTVRGDPCHHGITGQFTGRAYCWGGTTTRTRPDGGTRSVVRVAVLIGLLFAAGVALQGRVPGPRPAPQDSGGDSPASLVGVIALLGVSFVVMAFAMFNRRPPAPKAAPFEIPDFGRGGGGRINRRLLLFIALGVVVLWLAVVVVVGQFQFEPDLRQQTATPTTTTAPDRPDQPTTSAPREKPQSDTFRLLAGATGVLLVMMTVATVVAALRNRSKLPPIVVTAGPPAASPTPQPLAVAAERGLVEVANLSVEPRAAIIACYAAMEQALAGAPGAAPQASDTPSEVLARAVANRTVSTRSAATLVDLFAEARFSRHTMTEQHRDQAQQALRSVLEELRAGV